MATLKENINRVISLTNEEKTIIGKSFKKAKIPE
jgi:hypothetical protein